MYADGPFWGMHLFWWAFWIFAMVGVFGYNVPERARVNSLDPHMILKRRFAKGEISEDDYNKITSQLRRDEVQNQAIVQSDVIAQTTHQKVTGHPIVDGLSFSATWAISYGLCSLLYVIAPDAVMTATSKLFHGMSFSQMVQAGTPFGLSDFVSVLTVGAIYFFVAGIVWSFVHSFFLRQRAEIRLNKIEKQSIQKAQLNPL